MSSLVCDNLYPPIEGYHPSKDGTSKSRPWCAGAPGSRCPGGHARRTRGRALFAPVEPAGSARSARTLGSCARADRPPLVKG